MDVGLALVTDREPTVRDQPSQHPLDSPTILPQSPAAPDALAYDANLEPLAEGWVAAEGHTRQRLHALAVAVGQYHLKFGQSLRSAEEMTDPRCEGGCVLPRPLPVTQLSKKGCQVVRSPLRDGLEHTVILQQVAQESRV